MSDNSDAVAKSKIAELRKKLGLTQVQLAETIGVSSSTIANWEQGRRGIDDIMNIINLCKALDCEVRDLVEIEDWSNKDFTEVNFYDDEANEGYDFRGIDCSNTIFKGANLTKCNFKGVRLRSANFEKADLKYANFEGADLFEANFDGADLTCVNLKKSTLTQVKLDKANLKCTDLRDAKNFNLDNIDKFNIIFNEDKLNTFVIAGIPDQDADKIKAMYGDLKDGSIGKSGRSA